jgi:hypothetical protein
MYSKKQFTALEAMCRKQAALARIEMDLSLMKYWLAEAEEWKQLATAAADVVLARTVSAPPSGRHPLGRAGRPSPPDRGVPGAPEVGK